MKTVLAAILLTTATAAVQAQLSLKPDANTERELRALRHDFFEAIKTGDRASLERILADGYTFVHSTGGMESRKEFIDRVVTSARPSATPEVEFTDERLDIYEGRTAIWVTHSVSRNKATGAELIFRGTDVLVKVAGRWQWASVHSTALPSRPKAAAISHNLYPSYAGQYEIAPGRTLTVTDEGGTLKAVIPGYRPAELIPKSETDFVWFNPDSNVRAQIIFSKDELGRVMYAAFRRDEEEVWRAKKVK